MRLGAEVGPRLGPEDLDVLLFDGLLLDELAVLELPVEPGPERIPPEDVDLDEDAVLEPPVEPGPDRIPPEDVETVVLVFALDGAVRAGALKLLDVGRAEPDGFVRAGAFKLLDVGLFADVAALAAA